MLAITWLWERIYSSELSTCINPYDWVQHSIVHRDQAQVIKLLQDLQAPPSPIVPFNVSTAIGATTFRIGTCLGLSFQRFNGYWSNDPASEESLLL
jgi:hypothetical protein